jgi:hypothetical protein
VRVAKTRTTTAAITRKGTNVIPAAVGGIWVSRKAATTARDARIAQPICV